MAITKPMKMRGFVSLSVTLKKVGIDCAVGLCRLRQCAEHNPALVGLTLSHPLILRKTNKINVLLRMGLVAQLIDFIDKCRNEGMPEV